MASYHNGLLAAETHTTYVRTREGEVIHHRDCARLKLAKQSWPWRWAEGRHIDTIAYAAREVDLRACGHCRPLATATPDLRHAEVIALDQIGPDARAAS